MRNFSQFVSEGRSELEATSLLTSDITSFINKVKKRLPADVQRAIYLSVKLGLNTAKDIDTVRTANKSKLKDLVDKYNVQLSDLEDLWTLLKSIKQNYKVMPQYLSKHELEMLERGELATSDLTIDLETKAGRDAVAKMYTPLVLHIVNQLKNNTRLDKASLISAGMLGLTAAMNDWKREPDKESGKVVSFKTYAGYRIRQQILNDMNEYGHTLSGTNWYSTKKAQSEEGGGFGMLDAISLDGFTNNPDFDQDHFGALGVTDKNTNDDPAWKKVFATLERKFTQRDMDIFYRFFGVNNRAKEKSKDIAKSYGMSEGNIRNSVINKILKFLKTDNTLKDVLGDLLDIYTESLMRDMCGLNRTAIIEMLASDDTYILLEDLCKWNNAAGFNKSYKFAMSTLTPAEQNTIRDALAGGFKAIDGSLRKDQATFKKFLAAIDPTSTNFKTDGDIIAGMEDISNCALKYKQI